MNPHRPSKLPAARRTPSRSRPTWTACLIALLAAAPASAQRGAARGSQTVGSLLLAAADADGDGTVSKQERDRFLEALPDSSQTIDQFELLATLLRPQADTDDDGTPTRADVTGAFARLDRDEDGTLQPGERNRPGGGGRAGAAGGSMFDAIFAKAADADQDGNITTAEWQSFCDGLPAAGEAIPKSTLAAWLQAASRAETADRTAFTPSVWLLTIDASLDVDGDGRRTRADLQRAFADLDFDDDGDIDRADRQAARRAARDRARNRQQNAGEEQASPGHLPPAAITAADRARPCAVPFQRSLEDALALVRATGKPLLLCVNMDGETASEQLAWRYYRDPAFAKLTERYVPLIASPDDHTTRSYDDRGRRIPGHRFGRILDEEHVDIEPTLYARYFQGRRVAPRHVGVSADGEILFDLFLVANLNRIADTLREHGDPAPLPTATTLDELLASPDASHREQLEARFPSLDVAERRDLTARALSGAVRHPQIVRLALHDPAPEVREQAVMSLAKAGTSAEVDLFVPARREADGNLALQTALVDRLHVCLATATPAAPREPTVSEVKNPASVPDPALVRLARIASLQSGLNAGSRLIDVAAWHAALDGQAGQQLGLTAADLDRLDRDLGMLQAQREALGPAAAGTPAAARIDLALARATLAFTQVLILQGSDPGLYFDDVRRLASRLPSDHAEARALQAYASYMLRDPESAALHATAALPAYATRELAPTWLARELLVLFIKTRTKQLYDALGADQRFPAHHVADVLAAHRALLRHPLRTVEDYSACLDWLDVVGDWATEARLVQRGLADFPLAAPLHERFRGQLLRDRGADALELGYAQLEASGTTRAGIDWFAGVGSLLAAERRVQNDPETQQPAAALRSYRRATDLLRASIAAEPSYESSAGHWICLARSGEARVQLRAGDLQAAQIAILDACRTAPASTTWQDGLGTTPGQTAGMVLQRLRQPDSPAELADELEQALADLGVAVVMPTTER